MTDVNAIIDLQDLIVEFGEGAERLRVLEIPRWEVKKGDQVALSGPSGSGKSTLINVVAGLLSPSSGRVTVAGAEITGLGEASRDRFRAENIGYVFQTFNLLPGYTALENVLLGMTFASQRSDIDRARELLESVQLSHRTDHKPRQLSIGEQQRVAIARALAKKPKLLLADEPTGSLDPGNTAAIVELLARISRDQGCTLIVVSHEQDVVAAFDRVEDFMVLNRAFQDARGER